MFDVSENITTFIDIILNIFYNQATTLEDKNNPGILYVLIKLRYFQNR
nr:MAG TPA: hypothetical protein [Caudoviricetes sp.]